MPRRISARTKAAGRFAWMAPPKASVEPGLDERDRLVERRQLRSAAGGHDSESGITMRMNLLNSGRDMASDLLTPELVALREMVQDFGRREIRPRIVELEEAGRVPARALPADGRAGLLRLHRARGSRRHGRRVPRARDRLGVARLGVPADHGRDEPAGGDRPADDRELGRAELVAALRPRADRRRAARLQRHVRAGRRHRLPRRDAHDRGARRRRRT